MTIKEALKERKVSIKKTDNEGFWAVRLDVEVVEQAHIIEYVKASSGLEAQMTALKQFDKRTAELVHDRAPRSWRDEDRHSLQHLRVTETKRRKKFTISKLQRKILKALMEGRYLERNYSRWHLIDPTVKNRWGHHELKTVSSVSIDSLFQKGLLTDLITSSMDEQEVEVQKALGSLPELKAYTIDKEVVKTLGLHL